MEQVKKEVQSRPRSFIRAAGTCEGSVRRTIRRFDRSDVLIALFKAGIWADLDHTATIQDSRIATHSSFAIKSLIDIRSEFRSR